MEAKDQCNSCGHIGKGWSHEWCRYFTFAPSKPCTHNTFAPAAWQAMRMERVDRLAQRAQAQEVQQQ